jgi:ankyrin repeat protein
VPAPLHAYHEDFEYYEGRALGLRESARDGTEPAASAFAHQGAPLSEDGARTVVAAEHGFDSWDALREHVAALPDSDAPFARAYRAVEARDLNALARVLDGFPGLVHERGTNGNDLLGMAGATRDLRVCKLLLERGADPRKANVHGWTPLHQAAYGDQPALAEVLIKAGASADVPARGDGGTPLIVALFWGHRDVTEVLVAEGVVPANLRAAAGLGDLGLIEGLFGSDGRPTPQAGEHRGFYRPHGGFPPWTPACDDAQEVVDEALAWAARGDRVDALAPLVGHGARLQADVYRGTPLVWAAATGRAAAIRRLVELGADPNGRSTFGGLDHGRDLTPLHVAADDGKLDALQTLLELGADPRLRDGIYDTTPRAWAEHFGQHAAAELLGEAERL